MTTVSRRYLTMAPPPYRHTVPAEGQVGAPRRRWGGDGPHLPTDVELCTKSLVLFRQLIPSGFTRLLVKWSLQKVRLFKMKMQQTQRQNVKRSHKAEREEESSWLEFKREMMAESPEGVVSMELFQAMQTNTSYWKGRKWLNYPQPPRQGLSHQPDGSSSLRHSL